jgi:lipoprotein NlpD
LPLRQIVGEVRLARIDAKRGLRPLLVLVFFSVAGCASQTTLPKAKTQGIYHVVVPGDTLFRIGKAYGLSYQELARVNAIKDPGQIRVGQRIFIPGATRQLPVETITPTPMESLPAAPTSPETGFETFLWPVNGHINSGFGPRGLSFHDGIDIAAPEGTPIVAIEAGEVIYSDKLRGYGNMVIVRHSGGIVSVYAHNESNLVQQGQRVARGEVVAKVGSTGRVTGPHLHFEIRRNNLAEDPLRYLPQLCCLPASANVAPKG